MIRDVSQNEVVECFFYLMAEIEAGDHFDNSDDQYCKWLNRTISRRFGSGARFFGCFDRSNVPIGLGAVIIEDHPMFPGYSELVDLGVFAEYRRSGRGSELLAHAENLSREAGVFCMYIATYAGDAEIIAFYGRHGFAPVATLPDIHGPDDDGKLYMRKRL